MFADPQSVTINAVPVSLPRTSDDAGKSIYKSADGNVTMTISHQTSAGRTRHLVRIDKRVVAADPLAAANAYKTLGFYIVVDQPDFGFTAADIGYVSEGLKTWLSVANLTKIIGMES